MSIPNGWVAAQLGDVVELKYGKALPSSVRCAGTIPVYGSNGVVGEHVACLVSAPGIVVGRKGSIGEVHVSETAFWPIDTTYFADNLHGQPLAFWAHLLRFLPLSNLNRASAIPGLNREDAYALPIRLPPLNEQKRIVAKIEELTARSRRAKQALNAVPPLLEKLRQSILAAAFRGDLTADWRAKNPNVEPAGQLLADLRAKRIGGVTRRRQAAAEPATLEGLPPLPNTWAWASAAEIVEPGADIVYGIVQPGPALEKGVPYVRGKDIEDGVILVDQLWKTSETIASEYSRSSIRTGDVILCIIRHLKVAVVPDALDGGNLSRTTARLRPSAALSTEYLAGALRSPFCQGWLQSRYRGGTSMPKVNIADVVQLPVPIAPREEQVELCRLLKNATDRIDAVAAAVAALQNGSEQLSASILAAAFSGRLVPQDPTDEPASVLLDRIRAARETSAATTKPRRARKASAEAPAQLPLDLTPTTVESEVFPALWPRGPLDKDTAVRTLAEHLRDRKLVDFKRLRADGPLYKQLHTAIEAAVKSGELDRPRRGHVRAYKHEATAYTPDDWRHVLVASLGPEPIHQEDAIRQAAEWARDNLGLDFSRLPADGHISTGLRSAITNAIRQDLIKRDGPKRIVLAGG